MFLPLVHGWSNSDGRSFAFVVADSRRECAEPMEALSQQGAYYPDIILVPSLEDQMPPRAATLA